MLAEAIHSLADIGNQAMLRVGITYAAQAPTAQHPFGHMRDKFIFRWDCLAITAACTPACTQDVPERSPFCLVS